jgi:type I restriction-modification system DNA methylase subunit
MPILNPNDASQLDRHLTRFFEVDDGERANVLRQMFVGEMDFESAQGVVPLQPSPRHVILPETGELIATAEGFNVVYVALNLAETDRVRKSEAVQVAKRIESVLGPDMVVLLANTSVSQLHFIHPVFDTDTPTLRRMVIERDLPRRTVVQQLSKCYYEWHRKTLRQALLLAYDIEAVTSRFFDEYRIAFEQVEISIEGFGTDKNEQDARHLFTQTLFNRLMFVYFVSRKGWLSFEGDHEYLAAIWKSHGLTSSDVSFYDLRLKTLFFTGLNNEQSIDIVRNGEVIKSLIGEVPFLNGGLFEITSIEKDHSIEVPDDAIESILGPTGIFERFNFTVMESTPFDVEVAVDPEMLGKVFEELVTGRHDSGSYYTPRSVVSFMCREALKGYLVNSVSEASAVAITSFVDDRDPSGLTVEQARDISSSLEQVTVVDPASGSGAYLLGMMQELVELSQALFSNDLSATPRGLYDLKLHIIEQNLYGTDADDFAVSIAMLRLWLSLAIEFEGNYPPPLPNLDFKIICGDSLSGHSPRHPGQYQLFQNQVEIIADQITELKHLYVEAWGGEKKNLRNQILELESELTGFQSHSYFPSNSINWRTKFAEVFTSSDGFDIVLANPPYVRMELLDNKSEKLYKDNFSTVSAPRADLYVYFYELAHQLLRDGGSVALITSNKFFSAAYGERLRSYLHSSFSINSITNFGDLPIFGAAAYPAIFIAQKGNSGDQYELTVTQLEKPLRSQFKKSETAVTEESVGRAVSDIDGLINRHGWTDYPATELSKGNWTLIDPSMSEILSNLIDSFPNLNEVLDGQLYRGVVSGLDDAFVVDSATAKKLVTDDPNSAEILKPWLAGRDIKRWSPKSRDLQLIFCNRGIDIDSYPAVRQHLKKHKARLEKRATAHVHPWYELQQPQTGIFEHFSRPKIVWPSICKPNELKFCLDETGAFVNSKVYFIPEGYTWLLAILNSSVGLFVMGSLSTRLRGGYLELKSESVVGKMPIPAVTDEQKAEIESLVNSASSNGNSKNDAAIDSIIYKLYGLSEESQNLIESVRTEST